MKKLVERWKAETPYFFKKVINFGLILGGVGAAIISVPIALPAGIVTVGGYLVTAGLVASSVGKLAVQK